jgi:hypothetical protein
MNSRAIHPPGFFWISPPPTARLVPVISRWEPAFKNSLAHLPDIHTRHKKFLEKSRISRQTTQRRFRRISRPGTLRINFVLQEIPREMKPSFIIFAALIVSLLALSGCKSANEKVRIKVRDKVDLVTPKAIVQATSELDRRHFESEGSLVDLHTLPASLAAFEPVEVIYRFRGSYLIVTDRWVQHRSGLLIAAPDEVVPASTQSLIHEKLGDRLYFYQD